MKNINELTREIVSIFTLGGEFVGEVDGIDNNIITIKDARRFAATQEGVGFYPAVCASMDQKEKFTLFPIYTIISIGLVSKEIKDMWQEQTSQIKIVNGKINK